jgi:DNA-binding HxlR family transcriptional regulator
MTARKQNSTYTRNEDCIINCDLTYAVQKIEGRWKLQLLYKLSKNKLRFSELKKEFSYMSERMLSLQLKTMEKDGLIKRTAYAEIPPRVEYEITELALELVPILDQLSNWGSKQRNTV